MDRHPFALVESPSSQECALPLTHKRKFKTSSEKGTEDAVLRLKKRTEDATYAQFSPRPAYQVRLEEPAFSLVLGGQDADASIPVYGRGATVDGIIKFTHPSNIVKVEVKLEGFVRIREFHNGCTVSTPTVSELLVFWDAPNRLGGYGSDKEGHSGRFAPIPGSCPSSFSFKASLPTHYTESDGELTPLPPSFSAELPSAWVDVRYEIRVMLTRVLDVGIKAVNVPWKRKTVVRKRVEYKPRSRPSRQAPFPPSTKASARGPVTKFCSRLNSESAFEEPLKISLYLPNSQINSLSSPLPFFLRLSGPDPSIRAFDRPLLSSFLPKTKSTYDSFPTICGAIQNRLEHLSDHHAFNLHQRLAKLGHLFDLQSRHIGAGWGQLGRTSSRASESGSSSSSQESFEYISKTRRAPARVRLTLVRQIAIDNWDWEASSDLHPNFHKTEGDSYVTGFGDHESSEREERVKTIVLGEGVMYTADVSMGSIMWAGEVAIDPGLRDEMKCGGWRTRHLVVRDMLVLSVKDPRGGTSAPTLQQIIPIQFTTDAFDGT